MIHPEVAALTVPVEQLQRRRDALRRELGTGVILLPGSGLVWRNADNPHPFRQNSHLLYVAPVRLPGLALVLDADSGEDILFAPPEHPDELVWHGPQPSVADQAAAAGIHDVRDLDELPRWLREAQEGRREVHITRQFEPEVRGRLARWLGVAEDGLDERRSRPLTLALGNLRLHKSPDEVAEIERILEVTAEMFGAGMRAVQPGVSEAAVRGAMAQVAFTHDLDFSFSPIITVRGEILHNHSYGNTMRAGDLLLIDAGLDGRAGYASDISRTVPVGGTFSPEQRDLYQVVLAAQEAAIAAMAPDVSYRHVHHIACQTIARGLTDLGLMTGDPDEAVAAGAHALFFVHGVGHPLGLDVHDVHDLGDEVAYPPDQPRSQQFGTRFLRFGRDLAPGMVMTVEPGIYFIPPLIDEWRAERRFEEFVAYDQVERFRSFGGVRLEDDILVTDTGARLLGPPIPKRPAEVEAAAAWR